MDKQYILVDVMVNVSTNPIDEQEFHNKLVEWAKSNNWELNGFVGEFAEEGEYLYE